MSEITKLYENAGIKPKYSGWLDMGDLDTQMTYIQCDTKEEWDECVFISRSSYSSDDEDYDKPKMEYPPFTAEKQIQLILFILNTFKQGFNCRVEGGKISLDTLARGIAQEVINCWQDLTEEERKQIKEILG